MVDPQASQFWRFAVKSGLLDDAKLQACWDKLPEDKRTADAVDRRLARQAVNAGLLTVWQAQQLLTGRATGFKIDRYVLLDLIGQGGMGRVYLAKDTRLGRRVAIKVLSKERMSNPRAIARFQREAKVGAQLQHENLVRIYDQGESSGIHYLVMEHIDGKNAAQLIGERGSIAWPEAARLARQIALGLEHAQQKGLIHRDVNPANIMVTTREGVAKLADLGLAIDLADEEHVTRDGATVGTFDYISPEQARHSREVDTRADIYSLGCTLYHMIAGRVPFPTPSLPEKLYAHQLHDPEPLNSPSGDVPEGLAEIVARMMRKKPEERFSTPLAAAQALELFAEPGPGLSGSSASSSGLRASPASAPSAVAITPAVEIPAVTAPAAVATAPAVEVPAAVATAPAPAVAEANPLFGSGSDPEGALFALDTGPEAPLSESLSTASRPKPKPKKEPKPEQPVAEKKPEKKPRRKLVLSPRAKRSLPVAIGVVVVLAAIVGIVAVIAGDRKKLERPTKGDEDRRSTDTAPEGSTARPTGPIAVSIGGAFRPAATLAEAIEIAGGGSGEVVLSGSAPIRMSTAQEIRFPRGSVTVRAGDGPAPTVVVDVVGGKPWLLTLPNASIRLKGLRVVAHYQASPSPTPLIEAAGSIALERCIFIAAGAGGNARGVKVEGRKLSVDGCLFAGFDRALDITAFPGLDATITQSILADSPEAGHARGWAIRVVFGGGRDANRPRRLTIDHVTTRGGLLDVADFPLSSPLTVSLDHVAAQAPALLAWTPRNGESPEGWTKALKWTGKGNLYDMTGNAWVVASPAGDLPAPNAPRDMDGWKAAVGSDKDSTARSFKFAANAAEMAADLTTIGPEEFALQGEGVEGVGADGKRVGPVGGSPTVKKAEPSKDEPEKKSS